MKNAFVLTLLTCSLFIADATAQDSTRTQTWFSNSKSQHKLKYLGVYFAPEVQYGSMAGSFTPLSGMSAMWIFNKKLSFGLAGYGSVLDHTPTSLNSTKALEFKANYGGLKMEYTPMPNGVFHVSFPLLIGAAEARIDSTNANMFRGKRGGRGDRRDFEGNRGNRNEDAFFIIQPGINLETNVLRVAKLFVGANYRIAAGKSSLVNTNTAFIPTSKQLSGLSLSFGAKFGIFDFNVHKKRHLPRMRGNRRGHKNQKED